MVGESLTLLLLLQTTTNEETIMKVELFGEESFCVRTILLRHSSSEMGGCVSDISSCVWLHFPQEVAPTLSPSHFIVG